MATEVGSAYISLLPSMQGFSRKVQRELNGPMDKAGADAGKTFSKSMGKNVDSSAFDNLARKFSNFQKVVGVAPPKLIAATASVGLLTQTVSNLGAAIAPVGGLIVALPAVIGAAAIAFGTLKLATDGVGKAIGAGLSGDVKKFNKELEKLPKPAADFARQVVSLRPQLDKLKATLAGAMFKGFGAELKATAGTYLPMLQRQLPAVATALNGMGQAFLGAARRSAAFKGVTALIGSTAEALRRASQGVPALTTGLAQAAGAIGPFVADLGGGFASLAHQFGTFLSKASESGLLQRILKDALTTLSQMGTLLRNVGSILGSVLGAANSAGGSFLKTLGDLTGQFAGFLRSAEGSRALVAIFSAVSAVGRALGTALNAVLPALGKALVAMAPAVGPLADALAQVLVGLSPLLPVVGQLAVLVGTALTGGLRILVAALAPLIEQVSAALMPVLPILAESFGAILASVVPLAAAIGQALGGAMARLAPVLLQVAVAFGEALEPAIPKLTAAFLSLVPPLTKVIEQMGAGLMQALVDIIPMMPQLVDSGVELARSFADLMIAVSPLLPDLTKLATIVLSNRGGLLLLGAVMGHAALTMRLLAAGIRAGKSAFDAIRGAVSSFMGAIRQAASAVSRFVSGGVKALKEMPGKVKDIGGQIVDGIVRGITGGAQRVMDAARRLASSAADAIKRALKIASPSKVTAALGKWVGLGLAVGITSSTKDVVRAGQGMVDELRKALYKKTPGASRGLLRTVERENKSLLRLAVQRDLVSKRLAAATKSYQDLLKARTDYVDKVAESARSFAAITTLDGPATTKGVLANLRFKLAQVQKFAGLIKSLKAQGLNATTLDQIVQAGVDQGAGIAAALAKGGSAAIAETNTLQAGISSAAASLGTTAGSAMYDAGIKAAAGIVRGLQSQEKVLAAQMARLAKIMASQIKRSLGIRSPSRVMADEVGRFIPAGIAVGIARHAGLVRSEMDRLAMVPRVAAVRRPLVTAGAPAAPVRGGDTYVVHSRAEDPAEVARLVSANNAWNHR